MKYLAGCTMHGNQNHALSEERVNKYPNMGARIPAECGVEASNTGDEFKLDSVYSCKRCVKIVELLNGYEEFEARMKK